MQGVHYTRERGALARRHQRADAGRGRGEKNGKERCGEDGSELLDVIAGGLETLDDAIATHQMTGADHYEDDLMLA